MICYIRPNPGTTLALVFDFLLLVGFCSPVHGVLRQSKINSGECIPAGIYFIVATTNAETISEKIIVN